MTRRLQGNYKGNVGSLVGNIYLKPDRSPAPRKIVITDPAETERKYKAFIKEMFSKNTTLSDVANIITIDERLSNIKSEHGAEIKQHGEQTKIQEGFVYLVYNDSFPGWVKAGMTIDYEKRLDTYNLYHPLKEFRYLKVKWVQNRRMMEQILLDELSKIASDARGEWFKIEPDKACALFE